MDEKTIIILGGGIGGIVAARDLRRHLGHRHRIILIDKNSYHAFQPSLPWVVVGWRTPASVIRPFTSLNKYGIEFLNAEVSSIDPDGRTLLAGKTKYHFDYMILATGAENRLPEAYPGGSLKHSFYTFEGAVELSKLIPLMTTGEINIIQPDRDVKYPFAPFDAAHLIASFYHKRGIENIKVKIISRNKEPLPFAPDEVNLQVIKMLEASGIDYIVDESGGPGGDWRSDIGANLTGDPRQVVDILIPAMRPPDFLTRSGLTGKGGWVEVERLNLRTSHDNIFAIGDCAALRMPDGAILPKTGIFAQSQAEVVAYNISQELHGHSEGKEFSGYGFFFMETGNGRASNLHGNFLTDNRSKLSLSDPNVTFHWSKVVLEKYWLWRWL